jgi:hypothetical protein
MVMGLVLLLGHTVAADPPVRHKASMSKTPALTATARAPDARPMPSTRRDMPEASARGAARGNPGACCENGVCIGDFLDVDCVAIGGNWHPNATCGDFFPEKPLAICSLGCSYDNGPPLDDYGQPASQYAPDYPFAAGAADDFILKDPGDNDCRITHITTWTIHWNGAEYQGPNLYSGVWITVYGDADPKGPGGEPQDDGTHIGDVIVTQFVPIGSMTFVAEAPTCTHERWRLEIPVDFDLPKNVKMWLEIQPEMPSWNAGGGQSAVYLSQNSTGHNAQQIFELAGIPNWTEIGGNVDACPPMTPPAGTRKDLAFAMIGEKVAPPEYKWLQEPDLSTMGMDINSSMCYMCHAEPYLGGHKLADDFECTEQAPITEIHVWGSWQGDLLPLGNPTAVDFYLSIHEDIPAKPPAVPYSRPGDELWGSTFYPGDFTVRVHAADIEEWWYQPPHHSEGFAYFPGDWTCYEYIFDLTTMPFYQWGLPDRPVTYWLDVEARPYPLETPEAFFGWKTSVDHWNDDAVYTSAPELLPEPVWHELRYPGVPIADPPHPLAGESIDLAFGIIGGDPMEFVDHVVCEPQPPDHPSTYWYDVTPGLAGRCDFHVRVYDPDPCNYSNWVMPANYVAGVHQIGNESWVSWWDPTPDCKNAFFGPTPTTFGFDNDNPSTWGEWATSVGNSPDPYDPGGIADTSGSHSTEPNGSGYLVHVPYAPGPQPKWVQAPDMSVLGMDVSASRWTMYEHYWLADDFRCTTTGELTEIVVWGSWRNDAYPMGPLPPPIAWQQLLRSGHPCGRPRGSEPDRVQYARRSPLVARVPPAVYGTR